MIHRYTCNLIAQRKMKKHLSIFHWIFYEWKSSHKTSRCVWTHIILNLCRMQKYTTCHIYFSNVFIILKWIKKLNNKNEKSKNIIVKFITPLKRSRIFSVFSWTDHFTLGIIHVYCIHVPEKEMRIYIDKK